MSRVWYGSLDNRLMERCKGSSPCIGMGVTECCWSDRHPWEIIKVIDDRHLVIRRLSYEVVSGSCQDGSAEYEYFSDENNSTTNLFKTKQGKWVEKIGKAYGHTGWYIGRAEEYYDPSF